MRFTSTRLCVFQWKLAAESERWEKITKIETSTGTANSRQACIGEKKKFAAFLHLHIKSKVTLGQNNII